MDVGEARKFAGEHIAEVTGDGAVGDVHARMIVPPPSYERKKFRNFSQTGTVEAEELPPRTLTALADGRGRGGGSSLPSLMGYYLKVNAHQNDWRILDNVSKLVEKSAHVVSDTGGVGDGIGKPTTAPKGPNVVNSTDTSPGERPWAVDPDDYEPSAFLATELGIALRNHRRRRRISQADLGAMLGVSDVLVSKWETGKTRLRLDDLTRLASALGTTIPEMLVHRSTETSQTVNEVKDEAAVLKAQEQELLAAFRAMTLEQRGTALRVVQAIKE